MVDYVITLRDDDRTFLFENGRVVKPIAGGVSESLSPQEGALLEVLCERPDSVVSFDEIAERFSALSAGAEQPQNREHDKFKGHVAQHVRAIKDVFGLEKGSVARKSFITSISDIGYVLNAIVHATVRPTTSVAKALLGIPTHPYIHETSPPGQLLRSDCVLPDNPEGGRAGAGVVPFHLRREELAVLHEWCESLAPIAIRTYTGPGGTGKTRLMYKLCEERIQKGWRAGFLRRDALPGQRSLWTGLLQRSQSVLVVVDYAETRHEELEVLVRELVEIATTRVRIILLARAVREWWPRLKTLRDGVGDLFSSKATHDPIRLAPLAMTDTERKESFYFAVGAFARALGIKLPCTPKYPENLKAADLQPILFVHMQAMAEVQGVEVKELRKILDYMLDREQAFWEAQLKQREQPVGELAPAIREAMAVITAHGRAETHERVVDILRGRPLLKGQLESRLDVLARLLEEVYPGEDGGVEPLRPDPLGEHLVTVESLRNRRLALEIHGLRRH